MALDRNRLAAAATAKRVQWSEHARKRSAKRGFTPDGVLAVLASGEIIEEYPESRSFPAALLLGFVGKRPLHVVAALDPDAQASVYHHGVRPTLDKFEADWKTRREP